MIIDLEIVRKLLRLNKEDKPVLMINLSTGKITGKLPHLSNTAKIIRKILKLLKTE